jgi:hypothetical protein
MRPPNFDVVMRLAALCSKICRLNDIGLASNSRHLQMRGQKCVMGKRKNRKASRQERIEIIPLLNFIGPIPQ